MEKSKIIISKTGVINGRGSMRYKWVSGLTAEERKIVRDDGVVLIEDVEAHHHTQCGWKQVTYWNGKYYHREADIGQIPTEIK